MEDQKEYLRRLRTSELRAIVRVYHSTVHFAPSFSQRDTSGGLSIWNYATRAPLYLTLYIAE